MPDYRERLTPGIGTQLAFLLLAPAALLVFLPISVTIGVICAIIMPLVVIAGLYAAAPVIEVRDGVFRAGRAHIDTALIGDTEWFRGARAVDARGTGLDARAWTLMRGWVDPVVRVPILDATDPAPYWVVSTRHPKELAAALDRASTTTRSAAG